MLLSRERRASLSHFMKSHFIKLQFIKERAPHHLQTVRTSAAQLAERWSTMRPAVRYGVSALLATVLVLGTAFVTTFASNVNVLVNGSFDEGFYSADGCGVVGSGWHCFTNNGQANYGFYDDQWDPVVANGEHSQLIEINTKGVSAPDADRYAGIMQTVRVVDWAEYTLSLRGMIRTTVMEGDPYRYRVQVGWTPGTHADWTKVTNWVDTGWDTYYDRLSPGAFSDFATTFTAESNYVTVYIRVWKKWGVAEEEIDINLDAIALTGPSPHGGYHQYYPRKQKPAKHAPAQPMKPAPAQPVVQQPAPVQSATVCQGPELISNGNFESGFNYVAIGHVGKGWGLFTNGGAANYGFYDEQWPPVVTDGTHGQLIEINSKGFLPGDADRYAGIYHLVKGLHPGKEYEFSMKGLLRGTGNAEDAHRFEAQWGYNAGYDTRWEVVDNWTGMDLGTIHPREEPGEMASYSARFVAPADTVVIFIRGWKKWGTPEEEMDFNIDEVSLNGCVTTTPVHPTPGPQPGGECVYIVKPGDTLGTIAKHYGVTVKELIRANGIHDPNLIYVGQKLHLPNCSVHQPKPQPQPQPTPVAAHPKPQEYASHTVRPGETLGAICAQYGVDPSTVISMNNIADPNFIYVGQTIILP